MADPDPEAKVAAIDAFIVVTGATAQQAEEYLEANEWSMNPSVTSYWADVEERDGIPPPESAAAASTTASPSTYTGPRTLDGRPAPQYTSASSSSASKKPQKRTGVATLSSLGGGGGGGHGHGHGHSHDDDDDDDDEDYDDDDERNVPRDLFAGGEKSGLAVQDPSQRSSDPRRLINDIVAKAKANAKGSQNEPSTSAGPSRFRGGGQVLGGDGVESRAIPDPATSAIPTAPTDGPAEERVLHIWTDGFSIDDGELRRFDDPQNQADLQMIRQGRAPLHLMNVRFDQRVDVKLQQHNENYRILPRIYRPFGGEGRRLGSPVPGGGSAAATPVAAASTTTAAPAAAASGAGSATGVDSSQPTLMLRIQLPDGTRLPARFNTTQTVGDVYDFIQRAEPAISSRAWVVSTTFPNKDHVDKDLVLGDLAEFKRGGTAVVKWA
ncbi:hypothetical protein B0H67DRAFT_552424 [Lasiosphaeris hirsuta]|uniref:UBX domain-containing protein 1 n=1 Tax=Lasiosphaeris hirsuta TaxID=260670 RepID=A0AA40E0B5_9PEZI|nr:hypothetical protein B0H67DRAFT_552424 [Lasiosphaeris hirsuta]